MVAFRKEDREQVASGAITVSFRLWQRAQAKAGNRYATGFGTIEVDDVRVVPAALVTDEDVPRTGCSSVEEVWALAGEHTRATVTAETLLYRLEFRFLGDVPASVAKEAKTLPIAELVERLERMDSRSDSPWTFRTLELIEAAPRVPARLLAPELGRERLDFKANVRKLKALGLTVSHETGYELSVLGREVLETWRRGL